VNRSSRQICKAAPGSVELLIGIWRTVLESIVELHELGAIRDIDATDPPNLESPSTDELLSVFYFY